ncbi:MULTISPECIES: DeoR/GlpR family DNA-binding transcription regulator [unclassified Thermoanaerobacterium]|uniref:DeoR/GlpR family DNA-binding transcription regulator n=1 Tax=unclassified Thermoanaerobacterium TaxID=2622527 RepID=UPI000A14FAFB|nr:MULTISPECIES: DeoR/GlpR family DNA-binding transcription regulator [unclassified Thermoanaerobacterium]MDE4542839.1 DeoR/GlpR transcriptional regulator [Thermoanaerobacterium sp. R66]ORX22547.1 DeoR family transcriptional regulator [Thermoanaerobacterium sp. PSU-2]
MFGEERRMKIAEILSKDKSITVSELSEILGVSESTIRRDLKMLEIDGFIQRTHGGAILNTHTHYEPSFVEKEDYELPSKMQIGKMAASLIEEGDSVILDAGTTTLMIAKSLQDIHLTVVTNSPIIAIELSNRNNIELIVTGGIERLNTKALVGPIAEMVIRNFKVDKAFIGANAISYENGLMTPDIIEANTKKAMIDVSNEVYAVVDHTKFGKKSFVKFADISDITAIITDDELDYEIVRKYEQANVDVLNFGKDVLDGYDGDGKSGDRQDANSK